jgi:hypothetical protein
MTDEIHLLRGFGAGDPELPDDARLRIQERVLQEVLAAEAAAGAGRRRRGGWLFTTLRQLPVAAVAAVVIVALSFNNGHPGGQVASASEPIQHFISTTAAAMQQQQAVPVTTVGASAAAPDTGPVADPAGGTIPVESVSDADTAGQPSATPTIPDPLLIAQGPGALSYAQAAAIPTDEQLLIAILRGSTPDDPNHDEDFSPFRIAAAYVADDHVPGPVRAAFLRSIALMDGVDLGGTATDVLGRMGTVLARLDSTSGVRQQYLLDPASGHILEHLEFTTRGDIGPCPAGTIVALDVFDAAGQPVGPDAADAATWPVPQPQCDDGN